MKVLVGKMPMAEDKHLTDLIFLDPLIDEVPIKVIATLATMNNLLPFGMVVNALSDVNKRIEWDDNIENIQMLQNFATNGFIFRTKYKSISKITPAQDSVEK
jgi:hypothetical protein